MHAKIDKSVLDFMITLYIPGFFVSLGFSIVSPILPQYAESFGVSTGLASFIIAANAVGRILADIPMGSLCDRIGRRPLVVSGPLVATAAAMLCGLVPNFYALLVFRAIGGVGMAMFMIARQAMIADSIDLSIRGRIMGTFMMVNMIGAATGPTFGGIVYDLWKDYRAPFFFYALCTFASFVACFLLIKETSQPKKETDAVGGESHSQNQMVEVLKYVDFMIVIAAFSGFSTFVAFVARSLLIPLYGMNALSLSATEVGLILSFCTVLNIIVAMPGGMIVDKYGRKVGITLSLMVSALSYALIPFSTDFVSLLLWVALMGVAGGIGGGASMALAADLAPPHLRGAFLGFWTTIGDIGAAVGPIMCGFLADIYGLSGSFYGTAILIAAGGITTLLFVKETLGREKKKEIPS